MFLQRTAMHGFTLLELMITVTIAAILASVAVPSYLSHVRDGRRSEAKRALMEAAQSMESYYAMNMSYVGADLNGVPTVFSDKVPKDGNERYYTLRLNPVPTAQSYTITAIPQGGQSSDQCGTLSLNRAGVRSPDQSGCW